MKSGGSEIVCNTPSCTTGSVDHDCEITRENNYTEITCNTRMVKTNTWSYNEAPFTAVVLHQTKTGL